jgi:hypothetical protein
MGVGKLYTDVNEEITMRFAMDILQDALSVR